MIGYSYVRAPGGERYSATNRQAARRLAAVDAAPTITAEALEAMVSEVGISVVADVLFEVESNRLQRPITTVLQVAGANVSPSAGTVAAITNGKRVATTAEPATRFPAAGVGTRRVVMTWTDARPINVVEIHGDTTIGQITGVTVEVATAVGVWSTPVAYSAAEGRIAAQVAPYDDPVDAYGVRVTITAATGGAGGAVAVVEIDPMLVWDISEEVVSVEAIVAAEQEPGATTDPYGTYAASELTLVVDDTSGMWSNPSNTSLDSGHRVEVAFGVRYDDAGLVEELVPVGVFYSEPFDTDSDATAVTIHAVDRLGQRNETPISEQVSVGVSVDTLVRALCRTYLDLDGDQVVIDTALGAEVIPYAYPSGGLGSYLADVAKANGGVMHMDALDRFVLGRRTSATEDPVIEIRDDTALVKFTRPPGADTTTSQVVVNAAPLTLGADDEAWAMPSGGISIPASSDYTLVCTYTAPPLVNGYVTGVVADGSYTIAAAAYYADRAELKIHNNETRVLVVADLKIRGNPLEEQTLTSRAIHQPSVNRYGPKELTVDARLVQTQARVDALAAYLLDAFRSLNDDGIRRRPDLTFQALGLLHLAVGDRVSLLHPSKGLGGDYALLSRTLLYADGALLTNDVRAREAVGYDVLTYDVGEKYDDGHLYGF